MMRLKKLSPTRKNVTILLLSVTALAFVTVPFWVRFVTPDGSRLQMEPLGFFRAFGLLALGSTILWSVAGLFTVYDGGIFKYSTIIGSGVYKFTVLLALISLTACGFGMFFVFRGAIYAHLICVTVAEATFLAFDIVLIRRLQELWDDNTVDLAAPNGKWSESLARQLYAWLWYIDTPASIAFVLLIVGVVYLDFTRVLITHMEIEMFASGAVSFALITANLAFFAANLPEFVPGKRQRASDPDPV